MSQKTFEVVFSGKLVEGAVLEQVKANVAAMFKVEVAKVERLFSGATVSIKKGLDEATAKKYLMALSRAGAVCQVVNRAAVAEKPASSAPSSANAAAKAAPPPKAAAAKSSVTSVELGLQKSVVKESPQGVGELGAASIDDPGTILVEHQDIPVPEIDTHDLSLDQPGVALSEHEEVVAPQVDVSAFSMSEVGEILGEEKPFEELDVDLGEMSMDEIGVTLVEHQEVPKPEIDTSKLSLD